MRQRVSAKDRKVLATRLQRALKDDTKMLSRALQGILADDLVTAFLSRLEVLSHVENRRAERDLMVQCSDDILEFVHDRQGQN